MRALETGRVNRITAIPARPGIVEDAELPLPAEEVYGMVMPESVRIWTREMVLALPDDGKRYELFDGELLVTPAPTPRHQLAVALLGRLIGPYVDDHGLGVTMTSPADLDLDGGQLSQPDLFVLPGLPPDRLSWRGTPNPILAVEILSPSTAAWDRVVKRRRFQHSGIPEYWIVDLDARLIERWRPEDARPEILDQRLEWHPAEAPVPLGIDLPALFAEICGSV
jgi:Uma2 family endonuclease